MDRFLDKFTNLRQAILRLIVLKFKGFAMVLPSQVCLQADHIIIKMIILLCWGGITFPVIRSGFGSGGSVSSLWCGIFLCLIHKFYVILILLHHIPNLLN